MSGNDDIKAQAGRLLEFFSSNGARVIDTDILQSAHTLLELYGEDIRARAFVTHDPVAGEQMLRPDFTVPVVQAHMKEGAEPARYTYCGKVFRRQERATALPSEYLQVGYEVFDGSAPPEADAEVFALIGQALGACAPRAVTGDMGVLLSAIRGLDTSAARKAALLRHVWRPVRFRALLDRYSGKAPVPPARAALLSESDPMKRARPLIGLRTAREISERIESLRRDARKPPISAAETRLLDQILSLRAPMPAALSALEKMASDMPQLEQSVVRFAARMAALEERGVAIGDLMFEGSYGRTSMEYYDGFVFGFYAPDMPDDPIATGGRYDALTRILGSGRSIPAVGGVIRPGLLVEART